eukprot:TRINITY_DN6943_c0_g1_i1.p1 TRINITY_DN6943_c0_g1~~TRINITY_DN6943_c0_g1_i1.p1  ORF type:complete len:471 (-),score=120.52 TRINITY_DN6943_c0_g1_i1:66-1478(-)
MTTMITSLTNVRNGLVSLGNAASDMSANALQARSVLASLSWVPGMPSEDSIPVVPPEVGQQLAAVTVSLDVMMASLATVQLSLKMASAGLSGPQFTSLLPQMHATVSTAKLQLLQVDSAIATTTDGIQPYFTIAAQAQQALYAVTVLIMVAILLGSVLLAIAVGMMIVDWRADLVRPCAAIVSVTYAVSMLLVVVMFGVFYIAAIGSGDFCETYKDQLIRDTVSPSAMTVIECASGNVYNELGFASYFDLDTLLGGQSALLTVDSSQLLDALSLSSASVGIDLLDAGTNVPFVPSPQVGQLQSTHTVLSAIRGSLNPIFFGPALAPLDGLISLVGGLVSSANAMEAARVQIQSEMPTLRASLAEADGLTKAIARNVSVVQQEFRSVKSALQETYGSGDCAWISERYQHLDHTLCPVLNASVHATWLGLCLVSVAVVVLTACALMLVRCVSTEKRYRAASMAKTKSWWQNT